MTIRIGAQEIIVPAFMADPKHRKEFDRFLRQVLQTQADKLQKAPVFDDLKKLFGSFKK